MLRDIGRSGPSSKFRLLAVAAGMIAATWCGSAVAGKGVTHAAPAASGTGVAGKTGEAAAVERMVGRMLIVGFRGTTAAQPGPARIIRWLSEGRIGGVILFADNIESPGQIRALIDAFRKAATNGLPLIMVDQEGGIVQRFSGANGFTSVASAKSIGQESDLGDVYSEYRRSAIELASVGVNVNLGPVVDLDINKLNMVIAGRARSYGSDPVKVIEFARTFIAAYHELGILTAAKHFPGQGSSTADTHQAPVAMAKRWSERELEPYRDLAEDGMVDMIMISHLDWGGSHTEPACLSAPLIKEVLRGTVGFAGPIITDDLDMGAIHARYPRVTAAVKAVGAGEDLVLISNRSEADPELAPHIADAVWQAVDSGMIPFSAIASAADRIEKLKQRLVDAHRRMAMIRTTPSASATSAR